VIYLVKGGGQLRFSLYISDIGLLSSNENSMNARPLLCVTPSAYNTSLSEGSYSLLEISIACAGSHIITPLDNRSTVRKSIHFKIIFKILARKI